MDMDQQTANHITEYKMRERIIRRKRLNALLIMLEAQSEQSALDTDTQIGGSMENAREFYESQIDRVKVFLAPLDQVTTAYHTLLAQGQAADPSLFFGEVPPIQ